MSEDINSHEKAEKSRDKTETLKWLQSLRMEKKGGISWGKGWVRLAEEEGEGVRLKEGVVDWGNEGVRSGKREAE